MTLETMHTVVEELNRRQIPASVEYPGNIQAKVSDAIALVGGDVNETFDVDICESQDLNHIETIVSAIPSDSADVQQIADQFASAFEQAAQKIDQISS